jgi:putative transposase
MAPLTRRTWALSGQTPILRQRGRHREKVSLAAALWLDGHGQPQRLSYRTRPDDHFNNVAIAEFLDDLMDDTTRNVTVIWDGGNMHKGEPIRDLLRRHRRRLRLERLPTYAPMLNPIEQLWSWLKYGRLCNYAAEDLPSLCQAAHRELRRAQQTPSRLEAFWKACELATLLF